MAQRSSSSASGIQRSGLQSKTLSPLRLEKKRRTDRESQRAVRERTRNHILHLERLVESLKKAPGDDRLALIQQCQQLRDQNEQLKAAITNIGKLAGSVDVSDETRDNVTGSITSPLGTTSSTITESTADQQLAVDASSATQRAMPHVPFSNPSLWVQPSLSFEEQQHQGPKSPTSPARSNDMASASCAQEHTQIASIPQVVDILGAIPTCENTDVTIFESVNDVLLMAELFTAISTNPCEDVDIVIRAVINGWQVAAQMHTLDDGWGLLRQIDEQVFFSCGCVERLALLLIMRLKLRHTANPNVEHAKLLPRFMHSRPVQNLIQHPSLYDYLPWPELRDLFILSSSPERRRNSNQFAPLFTANIRFRWFHDISDVWEQNSSTSFYSFSDKFYDRFNDIQFWTLNSDFFNIRPDLIGYIPIYNPSPDTFLGRSMSQEDDDGDRVEQI